MFCKAISVVVRNVITSGMVSCRLQEDYLPELITRRVPVPRKNNLKASLPLKEGILIEIALKEGNLFENSSGHKFRAQFHVYFTKTML